MKGINMERNMARFALGESCFPEQKQGYLWGGCYEDYTSSPYSAQVGHVTCSGQLNVNRRMPILSGSFSSPCVAHQESFLSATMTSDALDRVKMAQSEDVMKQRDNNPQ